MNKELLELLDKINATKKEVRNLAGEGKLAEAEEKKKELQNLQKKFDLLKDISDDDKSSMEDKAKAGSAKKAEPGKENDAVKEFANAARRGFRVQNAMSSGIREGSDPDGGYIVPEDIQTTINQWKQAEFSLESLITVEADATGFADIEEGGELQEMDTPQFERIGYEISDRGGWLPLTNDLLSDTDQNIMQTITRWIARKSNATSNKKILNLINAVAAKEIETLDEVKHAIIVTLGAAYRAGSSILTNDDGLYFLATLKDTTGRDLLQPNPMDVMQMSLSVGPIRVPVISVPNKVIASNTETDGKIKLPMICGDFKEAFKKYDRQRTSLLASNIASAGSLNAFTQNLTLVRAIERNDFKTLDADAYVNLSMVIADPTKKGK